MHTPTWQVATLPRWPHHWRFTPTEDTGHTRVEQLVPCVEPRKEGKHGYLRNLLGVFHPLHAPTRSAEKDAGDRAPSDDRPDRDHQGVSRHLTGAPPGDYESAGVSGAPLY